MRIAQIAPLYESVPPQGYGGTERVVHVLTEQLVALGHQVTLFASGDSVTSAELVAPCQRSLRLDPRCHDSLAWHQLELALLAKDHMIGSSKCTVGELNQQPTAGDPQQPEPSVRQPPPESRSIAQFDRRSAQSRCRTRACGPAAARALSEASREAAERRQAPAGPRARTPKSRPQG
jgi:hypothetical protein